MHLASGRGQYDSHYCQSVKVQGEDIFTGNVIIIIKNWKNPTVNPLPRFENVDGLTLRYKHNGQPEKTTVAPKKVLEVKKTSEVVESEEKKTPAVETIAEELQPTISEVIVSSTEREKTRNEDAIPVVGDSREASKSKRKGADDLGEGGTPSKQTVSNPVVEIKEVDMEENISSEVDQNEDLNFNFDDFDLLKCAEKKS
jgi:hypothetical protein